MIDSMQLELQNFQLRSQVDSATAKWDQESFKDKNEKCYSLLACQTGRYL